MAHRPPFRTLLAAGALASSALLIGLPVPARGTDRPTMAVHVTVLARALIDSQRGPQTVVISEQDVARGYHDVPEALQVDFRSNHPNGVVLAFTSGSGFLEATEAFEAGMPLSAGASVYVPQRERGFRAHSVSLKLRLKLGPDARPGALPLPISVSLAPLK